MHSNNSYEYSLRWKDEVVTKVATMLIMWLGTSITQSHALSTLGFQKTSKFETCRLSCPRVSIDFMVVRNCTKFIKKGTS